MSASMLASSASLAPTRRTDGGEVVEQRVDQRGHVADRVPVLENQHLHGDLGCDVGVAVAVAADPAAEAQRSGSGVQRHVERRQLVAEVLEHVADGVQHELVEVVGRAARLVDRLGAVLAQLVGLPEQVDDLGDAQRRAPVLAGRGRRRAAPRPDVAWTGSTDGQPPSDAR